MFDRGDPEEFLKILINYEKEMPGTITSMPVWEIACLQNMLCEKDISEYGIIVTDNGITVKYQLLKIRKELTKYLSPANALVNQRQVMRMNNIQYMEVQCYTVHLQELNIYLPILTRSDDIKILPEEYLRYILLHTVT